MEWYLENGTLISQPQWTASVSRMHAAVRSMSADDLNRRWIAAFEQAVLKRAEAAGERIGVLLSGGIDSTLIAYVLWKNELPFTCYTVGFKDPRTKEPDDILDAKATASFYGWPHRCRVLALNELEPAIGRTASMLGDAADPVSVGIGTVIVAAADLAKEDGVTVLFGGLGAEEIFAGYHRHRKAHSAGDLDGETWGGLLRMYGRDMIRDARIACALGITIPTPFMDPAVMTLAARMPDDEKILDGHKKYVLRSMAVEYGLAPMFAFRPKRAAQYGSRVQKAIARLAKRAMLSEDDYIKRVAGPISFASL